MSPSNVFVHSIVPEAEIFVSTAPPVAPATRQPPSAVAATAFAWSLFAPPMATCQSKNPSNLVFTTHPSCPPRFPVTFPSFPIVFPHIKYASLVELIAIEFPISSAELPKHFCHSKKEVGGGEEGGFAVAISSGCIGVAVSFLQLKSPKIKMRLEVMINFFIVLVLVVTRM